MKTQPSWPARLADAGGAPGDDDPVGGEAAARAGELLRALHAPPPLSAAALSRIDARLRAAQEAGAAPARSRRAPALVALGLMAAGAAAALILILARPAPGPDPAAVAQRQGPSAPPGPPGLIDLSVPPGGVAKLAGAQGAQLSLLGPGRATEGKDGRLSVESGRLRVKAGQGQVVIAVPGGQVVVRGEAEIEVRQRGAVRVASYVGGATLSWGGRTIEVEAGTAWSAEEAAPAAEPAAEKEGRQARPRRPAPEPGPEPGQKIAEPAPAPAAPVPAQDAVTPGARAGAAGSALSAESQLLSEALRLLRREDDPRGALALLLSHEERFPKGALRPEAQGAQVEALLRLGRRAEALRLLERLPVSGLPRADELRLLRGELRGEAGRCAEAVADFSAILDRPGAAGAAGERALYGRASCRARQGDKAGARADLVSYLSRYPSGKFSDEAREALGK